MRRSGRSFAEYRLDILGSHDLLLTVEQVPMFHAMVAVRGLRGGRREHWTNVYWPVAEANGGWVDYMRLGYGKPKEHIVELARRHYEFVAWHPTKNNYIRV